MAPTSVSQGATNICDTPTCHALSKRLLETVNLNVDPCSDFFQYTCKFTLLLHTPVFFNA